MIAEVSVVVPTRDRKASVARTVRSLVAQEPVVEVIVVDDGSTDGTAEDLARRAIPGVRVVRRPASLGVSAARNAGIEEASAPWVGFCDDDDVWAPAKLRMQLDALEGDPGADWSAVGSVWVDPAGRVLRGDLPPPSGDIAREVIRENPIPGGASGVLARTDAIRRLGGFDEELRTLADWDLWIRLAVAGPMAAVPRPLVAYQIHASNMSFDIGRRRRELVVLERKHAATFEALGVTIDRARQRRYDAAMSLRAGHRLGPALHEAVDAVRRRRPTRLKRAALALVAPATLQARDDDRKVAVLPPGWSDEVDAWLPEAWS